MAFETVKIGTDKYTEVLADANKFYNCSPNFAVRTKATREILADIHFQDGPVKEVGINGVANEDLIVMVMHRLNQFQKSDYACKENADAVRHLQDALDSLRARTNKRVQRGVVGTSNK